MSEQTKEQSVWHDKDDTLESKVYQAIGAGSMCWSETPKGVFDSDNVELADRPRSGGWRQADVRRGRSPHSGQ